MRLLVAGAVGFAARSSMQTSRGGASVDSSDANPEIAGHQSPVDGVERWLASRQSLERPFSDQP